MMNRLVCLVALGLILASVPAAVAAFDPLTDPSLIGWWRCDEGQGNLVADSSPAQRDGTFVAGTAGWTTGIAGSAVDLTPPALVEMAPMNLTLTQATMSGWVLPRGAQQDWCAILMHRNTGRSGSASGFNMLADGHLAYHWNDDAASWSYRGTAFYAADDWTHCAVTIDSTKATFYVNGTQMSSNTLAHASSTWDGSVWIGGDRTFTSPQRHWNGAIDEVQFFSRALTATEVKALVTLRPKARTPSPADGAVGITMALLSWTKGDGAARHNIYLGLTPELTDADLIKANLTKTTYPYVDELVPGATYYWRVDEYDSKGNLTATGDVWKFTVEPVTAYSPNPADGSTVRFPNLNPTVTLSWMMPTTSMAEHLYFSSVQSEVANAAATAAQDLPDPSPSSFDPGVLRSYTTYYWRVDETVLDPDTSEEVVMPGPVWSFTTGDAVSNKIIREWWTGISSGGTVAQLTGDARFPNNPTGTGLLDTFKGPTGFADYYGTRMYGWLIPPQTGDYTFWVASDDGSQLSLSTDADPANAVPIASISTWSGEDSWAENASQQSAPITLTAGQKYFIQVLHAEGTGGDHLSVAWGGPSIGAGPTIISAQYVDAFALMPLQAYAPSPANQAVDVPSDGALSWKAGEQAQKHDVYFGADANAVAAADTSSPLYQGQQTGTSFAPGALEWGKTYYWRVDEVGTTGTEKGNVWSFTTRNFLLIDDFESYTGDIGNEVFSVWLDNYDPAATVQKGALVGTDTVPFVETRALYVHGGRQSMPLRYDNSGPTYLVSETVGTIDAPDWTAQGVTDLSLWVLGHPQAVVETAPGQYRMSANSADVWGSADTFSFYYKTLTGDGSIMAKVVSVSSNAADWTKAGVMIRDTLDPASAYAFMFPTPNGRRAFQQRPSTGAGALSAHSGIALVRLPFWVKVERKGNEITAYYSTDGTNWIPQPDTENTGGDASTNPVTIPMGASVCIGIAFAANDINRLSISADFSNVSTTGTVTGNWTATAVGANNVNTPEKLYVILEDSTGKKTPPVSDPTLVNVATWTQWKIPLSSFTGISMSKVKKVHIGVGDPQNPVAGGAGQIYLDDIQVIKP